MTKLKIRQYWTEFGRPWYVIRYGVKVHEYFTADTNSLPHWVKLAWKEAHVRSLAI